MSQWIVQYRCMLRSWERLPAPVRYLAPRLAALPALWVATTLAVFLLLSLNDPFASVPHGDGSPGDGVSVRDAPTVNDAEVGVYVDWMVDLARGDFGRSRFNGREVGPIEVREKSGATAELVVLSLMFGATTGGAVAWLARKRRLCGPQLTSALVAAFMASVPVFVFGTLILIIPSQAWGYSPTLGRFVAFQHGPWTNLKQAIPPAIAMAMPVAAFVAIDVRRRERRQWALADVALSALRAFPIALTSASVAELIFTIPGFALLLYNSAVSLDVVVLRSVSSVLIFSSLVVWLFLPRSADVAPAASATALRSVGGRQPVILLGGGLVSVFLAAGVMGPWLAPHSPYRLPGTIGEAWSWTYPLGTDNVGHDELSRVLYAMRSSVRFATAVLVFGFVSGTLAAVLVGRFAVWAARFVAEMAAALSAAPWLVVLFLLITAYGYSLRMLAVGFGAYAFLSALSLAPRVVNMEPESLRRLGSRLAPQVAARAASAISLAILGEATLSFFGLTDNRVSLGRDLSSVRQSFPFNYWLESAAGGALVLVLLGFNLLQFTAVDSGMSNDSVASVADRED